jgi:hypothetical protein
MSCAPNVVSISGLSLRFSLTFIYYLRYVMCLVCPMLPVSLDCSFLIVAQFSLTFIYYLLYVLCLVWPMLPVSLDCSFLIVARFSLAFIYYLLSVLCLVWPMLPVSLDCPFLIVPSVFSNVCLREYDNLLLHAVYNNLIVSLI